MIKKGEAYNGDANILGKVYVTGYEPIKEASVDVIGIYYVGVRDWTIGADGHATKPLSAHDLIGSVRGLLRRSAPERASYVLVSGDIVLDRPMRKVARGDREISMAASECRLLEVFLEKPRQVLSRSYLLDHVWGQDAGVDERTVDAYVARLRKSLIRKNDFDPIRTVRGAGYVFDGRSQREPAKAEREPHQRTESLRMRLRCHETKFPQP